MFLPGDEVILTGTNLQAINALREVEEHKPPLKGDEVFTILSLPIQGPVGLMCNAVQKDDPSGKIWSVYMEDMEAAE